MSRDLQQDLEALLSTVVRWVFGIALVAFAVWWSLPDTWRIKYAARYMVDYDQVIVEPRPYDCEWDSAPLGNKHCHYEKVVAVFNAENQVIEDSSQANPVPTDQNAAKVYIGWRRTED